MRITINLTEHDYMKLMFANFIKSKKYMIFVVAYFFLLLFNAFYSKDFKSLVGSVLSFIIIVPIVYFLIKRALINGIRKSKGLGERTIELTDSSFNIDTNETHSSINWNKIMRISKGKTSYFIYVDNTPMFIIPKRSFNTESEEMNFVEFINKKINSA